MSSDLAQILSELVNLNQKVDEAIVEIGHLKERWAIYHNYIKLGSVDELKVLKQGKERLLQGMENYVKEGKLPFEEYLKVLNFFNDDAFFNKEKE